MDERESPTTTMYWCHMCNRRVEPIIQTETVECPLCHSGFVEQMNHTISTPRVNPQIPNEYLFESEGEIGPNSDRSLSLWAPVLLGMMSNPRRRRRFRRRIEFNYEDNDDILSGMDEGETELDRELQSFVRTRRRNSASILQFLQGIRTDTVSESNNDSENENGGDQERETTEVRDRNRVILINRLNQTIILQGGNFRNRNQRSSLGDYFVGPGLELLLQHLSENDFNRYGTPPAKKEDMEAMPTVKIKENLQCSICLDNFDIGTEAKEMPCKHKFHSECIFPWLELHSSCPICRYQMPSDSSKIDSDMPTNNNINSNINIDSNDVSSSERNNGDSSNGRGNGERNGTSENRRRFSVPLPWPFNNLFSSSGSGGSSSSSTDATRNASSTDEN